MAGSRARVGFVGAVGVRGGLGSMGLDILVVVLFLRVGGVRVSCARFVCVWSMCARRRLFEYMNVEIFESFDPRDRFKSYPLPNG